MPQATPDQTIQIAKIFSGFAALVEDFRFTHIRELTTDEECSLRDKETSLRKKSSDFLDSGINALLDDAAGTVADLGKVTDLAKADLKKLNDINSALEVITSLIQVGTALASGNPGSVGGAIQSAFSTLSAAAGEDGNSGKDKTQAAV